MNDQARKTILLIVATVLFLAMAFGIIWSQRMNGLGEKGGETDASSEAELTGSSSVAGLSVSKGFSLSVLAANVPGARVMIEDSFGNVWISQTREGKISYLEMRDDGTAILRDGVLRGLNNPHGLAFDPNGFDLLYYAETDKISRVTLYSDDRPQKIYDLPGGGGGHFTRTLGFGPDGRLYVSIGSSCNVCREADQRRAAIISMDRNGGQVENFAKGLRNAVFFEWGPGGELFATEMGRDHLGDNLPPDEINIIEKGKDYGWPYCYGQNIQDKEFDASSGATARCQKATPPLVEIPAHSAPLGFVFLEGEKWPAQYRGDLLVAYHGSWNRTEKTGYKIVRVDMENGEPKGVSDFVTGWLKSDDLVSGRPVDIIVHKETGTILVSDDQSGRIYQLKPIGE